MLWTAVVPGFSVLSMSHYPHTRMSIMAVVPQREGNVAAVSHVLRSLGDLLMKDLAEWHIFVKAFSIHLLFSRGNKKFCKDRAP